jgi:hypothetical protein
LAESSFRTVWPDAGNIASAASRFMPRMLRDSNACAHVQANRSVLGTAQAAPCIPRKQPDAVEEDGEDVPAELVALPTTFQEQRWHLLG